MMQNTTFINRSKFRTSLASAVAKFEKIYMKTDLALHEKLYPLQKNSYHFIGKLLKETRQNSRIEKVFTSQVFEAVYRSEVFSAGSSEIAFLYALSLAKKLEHSNISFENEALILADYEKFMAKLKESFIVHTKSATKKDIKDMFLTTCSGDKLLAETIWQAVELAGLEGRIFIENGRQSNYVVELKEGYSFNLNPFNWMLKNNSWERNECKILVVDGMVEKVSELDQILTRTFATKQPLVIIALGFSEEVAATLKANQDRGLLDIQPVRVPSDLDSLNITNDISVVCGTTPLSSMKGDLITFVKYDELPTVNKIRLSPGKCTIENNKTRAAVSAQVTSLLEKRHDNKLYIDIQNLMDKRLRSLVSNAVTITLPNFSTIKTNAQRVQIDIALRQCKTLLSYGITDFSKSIKSLQHETELDKIFYKALEEIELKHDSLPTLSAAIGCMLSGKAMLMLYMSSGFVSFT